MVLFMVVVGLQFQGGLLPNERQPPGTTSPPPSAVHQPIRATDQTHIFFCNFLCLLVLNFLLATHRDNRPTFPNKYFLQPVLLPLRPVPSTNPSRQQINVSKQKFFATFLGFLVFFLFLLMYLKS